MTADGSHTHGHGPAGVARLASADGHARLLAAFVAGQAPRLFALVDEPGDEPEGRIVAWGLQFDDYAVVVGYGGEMVCSWSSAERARRLFARQGTTLRLIWCSPADNDGFHPTL